MPIKFLRRVLLQSRCQLHVSYASSRSSFMFESRGQHPAPLDMILAGCSKMIERMRGLRKPASWERSAPWNVIESYHDEEQDERYRYCRWDGQNDLMITSKKCLCWEASRMASQSELVAVKSFNHVPALNSLPKVLGKTWFNFKEKLKKATNTLSCNVI